MDADRDREIAAVREEIERLTRELGQAIENRHRAIDDLAQLIRETARQKAAIEATCHPSGSGMFDKWLEDYMRKQRAASLARLAKQVAETKADIAARKRKAQEQVQGKRAQLAEARARLKALTAAARAQR